MVAVEICSVATKVAILFVIGTVVVAWYFVVSWL